MTTATIVTTVPAVVHAIMVSVGSAKMVAVTMVVAGAADPVPSMGAAIGVIEMGTSEVEVVTVRITGIDAEVPVTGVPIQWAVEIGSCYESIPLPVEKDIAQVEIAALPVGSVHIVTAGDTHQIVQIDLIGCLVLLVSQVQLVCHLVGQEQGFVASLLITHCVCRDRCRQHHHQCEKQTLRAHNHFLHTLSLLKGFTSFVLFHLQL